MTEPVFVIHSASLSGSRDTLGNFASPEDLESEGLQDLLTTFPELIGMLTLPQIVERLKRLGRRPLGQ